jgi:hypothetical protein
MGISDEVRSQLAMKLEVLFPHLDERQRRLLMGAGSWGMEGSGPSRERQG